MTAAAIVAFIVTHAAFFLSGWFSHRNSLGLDAPTLDALKASTAHNRLLTGHRSLQQTAQVGGALLGSLPVPVATPVPPHTAPAVRRLQPTPPGV